MAASGYCEVMVSPLHTILFSWSINNQSGLDSLIDYSFTLTSREGGAIEGASSKTLRYTFGGGHWDSRSVNINVGENSSTSLVSGWSAVISHDEYGYGSFTMSFEFAFDHTVNGEYIGTITDSSTFTLDRILPRTSLSVQNGTLGETQTLTVSRHANGEYLHTITYKCGDDSGTICTNSADYSYSFTPPLNWANFAPNENAVTVTFEIVTEGLTSTPLKYVVTYAIPDNVVPSCSLNISDPLGHFEIFGAYIQNQCRLVVDTTAEAPYGAEILKYKITVDGNTYNEASFETDVLTATGTLTITATVTDSRARSATITQDITVLPYNSPQITALDVYRTNEDRTENDEGLFATVFYSYAITKLNNLNGRKIELQYKKTTEATYTTVDLPSQYEADYSAYTFPAEDDSAYDVRLIITDSFNEENPTIRKTSVSTATTLMHLPASGRGISFGAFSDRDGFNVWWKAFFHAGMSFVIEDKNGGDCDTLTETGYYYVRNGANCPNNSDGWLDVKESPIEEKCLQEFTTVSGAKFFRVFGVTEWTSI